MSIDKNKKKNLIKKILELEKNNIKTKDYNRVEIADQIVKMIKEEVHKCY